MQYNDFQSKMFFTVGANLCVRPNYIGVLALIILLWGGHAGPPRRSQSNRIPLVLYIRSLNYKE